MTLTRFGFGLVLLIAATTAPSVADDKKDDAKEIVINIKGAGAHGKYIQEGATEQKPVTVMIGQKVIWKNEAGNAPHTATSKLKVDDKELFHTGMIKAGESKSVDFDEALYTKAGGKDGKEVELEYICKIHGEENMKSKIILRPAAK